MAPRATMVTQILQTRMIAYDHAARIMVPLPAALGSLSQVRSDGLKAGFGIVQGPAKRPHLGRFADWLVLAIADGPLLGRQRTVGS